MAFWWVLCPCFWHRGLEAAAVAVDFDPGRMFDSCVISSGGGNRCPLVIPLFCSLTFRH